MLSYEYKSKPQSAREIADKVLFSTCMVTTRFCQRQNILSFGSGISEQGVRTTFVMWGRVYERRRKKSQVAG